MSDETTTTTAHDINGGAPTDEEARLVAQLDGLGDNPTVDPDAAAATAAADASAGDQGTVADTTAAASGGADAGAGGEAATATATAAAAAETAAAVPAAAATTAAPHPPVASKDFDAEFVALQERYDAGEMDSADFQKASRAISKEEAAHQTRVTLFEENARTAQQQAEAAFSTAAVKFEQENKAFLENPIRRDAMQRAIATIDQETHGTLAPDVLIAQAAKVAFEAFNYAPVQTANIAATPSAEEAIRLATEGRKVAPVPATLGTAPAAASMERGGGNALFAELDGKDINTLEDALARMSKTQLDAYLLDAPGATATGVPG